jgi:hypothetical protein
MRYVRKLAARVKRDPAELDEAQLRAHLLHLKDGKDGHGYSASSMRTATAAFTAFYNLHLGRECRFDFAQGPEPVEGETVPAGAFAFAANVAHGAHPRRGEATFHRDPGGTLSCDPTADLCVRAAGVGSDQPGSWADQARLAAATSKKEEVQQGAPRAAAESGQQKNAGRIHQSAVSMSEFRRQKLVLRHDPVHPREIRKTGVGRTLLFRSRLLDVECCNFCRKWRSVLLGSIEPEGFN